MIRKYRDEDFKFLKSWVTDPFLLFQFAGPGWKFPLTEEQIRQHQLLYPFKQLYIGCDDNGDAYAIGEIITNEPHSPRLGRLLVGERALRGKGLGTKFISELIDECKRLHPADSICLFVMEGNDSAINCYLKLGFRFSDEEIPDMIYEGVPRKILKMSLETRL
ncbi:GNAT family N-acetyltransferase [Flavihumibacter sp.]|uniref:GNAT family N-acetyltransferase n=1 Tax=Flavihumibacter sp. TaxID=1913981 RepID=UPI002FCB2EE2|nr:GNAT family N-acetyltransferase [Flavihumibacter sediminis]